MRWPASAAGGYANTIAGGALVLALAYVTLEIRRFYHGPVLTGGATSGAEQYTYSIAWLAFGVVLLGVGILVNSQRARLASAVVIALTILKAFLIDMSTLTGVYRALSFMCLGLVLVGDRLAVPAHPVPAAGRTAAGSAGGRVRIRPREPIPGIARPRPSAGCCRSPAISPPKAPASRPSRSRSRRAARR